MQSHLSAQMCRLEAPSRSVESEPENVLNTASPGRSSSWILPTEMLSTPDRPTASGLQSPSGVPMQYGPSPATQEHCRQSPCRAPPAQWGNNFARESGEEECELFGDLPAAQAEPLQVDSAQHEAHQDELDRAAIPSSSNASNLTGPRCTNGELVRPTPPRDDSPSTACQASTVCASGGVRLGKANPPCFGVLPGIVPVPSREIPPPPPPPSSCEVLGCCPDYLTTYMGLCWGPLNVNFSTQPHLPQIYSYLGACWARNKSRKGAAQQSKCPPPLHSLYAH